MVSGVCFRGETLAHSISLTAFAAFTSNALGVNADFLTSTDESLMRQSPSRGRRVVEEADTFPPMADVQAWSWQKTFPLNSCHASDGRGRTLRKMLGGGGGGGGGVERKKKQRQNECL